MIFSFEVNTMAIGLQHSITMNEIDVEYLMLNGYRFDGAMGSSFIVPYGFENISPDRTAVGYYYDFYNYDLEMDFVVTEVAMAAIPPENIDEDYIEMKNGYSNEYYEIVYDVKNENHYVISGYDFTDNTIFYFNTIIDSNDIRIQLQAKYPNDDLKLERDELLNSIVENWSIENSSNNNTIDLPLDNPDSSESESLDSVPVDDSVVADITLRNGNVVVDLNEAMFSSDNTTFNYDIAKLAVTLSEAAYDDKGKTKKGDYIVDAYKSLGFKDEDITLYSYPDSPYNASDKIFQDKTLAFSIANRKLGEKTLLVIDFRGTKPFGDIIKDLKGGLLFVDKKGNAHTRDKQFLQTYVWGGFYDFWEDYNTAMDDYYYSHPNLQKADEEGNLIVLVTGHSLGGAAANLTGKSLNEGASEFCNLSKNNIYVYTFASPLACLESTADDNIFNIVNLDDLVPFIPPGYLRYGKAEVFETGNKFFDGYNLSTNHSCGTYLDAVFNNKLTEKNEPIEKKFRLGAIFCPVDIEIIKDGAVVGKVVNNEVVTCEDNINFEIEDDHKFFVLPDEDTYTVKINATDDGQMSFYLVSSDSDYMIAYSDIDIKSGDYFVAEIPVNEELDKTKLNYKNGKKNVTVPEDTENKTSGEQFAKSKNKKEKSATVYIIIGLAVALLISFVFILVLIIRNKNKKDKKTINANNNISLNFVDNKKGSEAEIKSPMQSEPELEVIEQEHKEPEYKFNESVNNKPEPVKIESENYKPELEQRVFCTECGKELTNMHRFCPVCGTPNKMYKE